VAAPVPHFIPFEVGNLIDTLCGLGSLAALWSWAFVAMFGMITVIYVAAEVIRAMKPRASTNEDAAAKPFRAVVAVRSAAIGIGVIVSVRTIRGDSDGDADLSLRF
jgi:hypothetical protein